MIRVKENSNQKQDLPSALDKVYKNQKIAKNNDNGSTQKVKNTGFQHRRRHFCSF